MNAVEYGKRYAISCHEKVNHLYDNQPYSIHLEMVAGYAKSFGYLDFSPKEFESVLIAAYCHDVIEDTRQTYNDVRSNVGSEVADIVYALTNEKGKTRKERANDKYYDEMRIVRGAVFVKLCDRLANVEYSIKKSSGMAGLYKKEHPHFKEKLYSNEYRAIWDELARLLVLE